MGDWDDCLIGSAIGGAIESAADATAALFGSRKGGKKPPPKKEGPPPGKGYRCAWCGETRPRLTVRWQGERYCHGDDGDPSSPSCLQQARAK